MATEFKTKRKGSAGETLAPGDWPNCEWRSHTGLARDGVMRTIGFKWAPEGGDPADYTQVRGQIRESECVCVCVHICLSSAQQCKEMGNVQDGFSSSSNAPTAPK